MQLQNFIKRFIAEVPSREDVLREQLLLTEIRSWSVECCLNHFEMGLSGGIWKRASKSEDFVYNCTLLNTNARVFL